MEYRTVHSLRAALAAFMFLLIGSTAAAQDRLTVWIEDYDHRGCSTDGEVHRPAGAGDGSRFRIGFTTQADCDMAFRRLAAGCTLAVRYPAVSPDGDPWEPGEKNPACIRHFQAEVASCQKHYTAQRAKCTPPGPSLECRSLLNELQRQTQMCMNGDAYVCENLEGLVELTEQECR